MTGPNAVAGLMAQRLKELHAVIEEMNIAEQDAFTSRHAADLAEAKAYLTAEGSIENRKQIAKVQTAQLEFDALAAEANVRHLSRLYKEAQMRVEAGRTLSADLRAELAALGRDGAA